MSGKKIKCKHLYKQPNYSKNNRHKHGQVAELVDALA